MPWKGKKVFEEEKNENKKGKNWGVTINYMQKKGDRKVKYRDDEILGFDFLIAD